MKLTPAQAAIFNASILASQRFLIGELYTFALRDSTQVYFTNLDLDISYGGNTFVSNSLRVEGLKYKIAVGWQVDEQDIKISALPSDTLAGAAFFGAVEEGLLDGAYLIRQRGFWTVSSGIAYQDFQQPPLVVVTLFTGRVSTIAKIGRTHVEMKLKSPMVLLDIDMPRNTYQPGCQWSLFDQGCTLNRASFTNMFVVQSATNVVVTPVTFGTPVTGGDGLPYYEQGRITFTSGVNNNLISSVKTSDGVSFYLRFPLDNVPAPGDTFSASAGCSKTSDTCTLKFGNLANFRGFPRVPPIMISV